MAETVVSYGRKPERPIVLVTGASHGIGAATARLFAAEGYDVCVNYLSDTDAAEQVVRDCQTAGARAVAVQANIGDRKEVEQLFLACDKALGRLSSLINNAGIIGKACRMEELQQEELERTFAVNTFGVVYCTQEASRRMSTRKGGNGGSIINMSSLAAALGSPNEYIHYAASKGAVETITIGSGKELAPEGIRVNGIRVGTTNTRIHTQGGNPERPAKIAALTPMGRIAEPDDIAKAALWLASPGSGFVTGTLITVTGGL
ncbi:SDR family oxidoreductase [Falsochrobactrum ovis]|uniref:NAD(P)-dependent dehydrogenase (Short-subunit alcohol dehydrogenase family) n=1 Tax=Falsochrobactrum ovis TaxID=1293442 RepID=A0A364JTD0_9HYPH|nr:SDR family oxidoreductase [Falsochrobactrum ovis]RAK27048.1 NAD(P)-dependent dehydrogenase (short-subunit alcohol dehydrogenase family) [Falsochrobactrum ovis]